MKFQVTNYRPEHGWAVAERPDGRQYNIEIAEGIAYDVVAVGERRKVNVTANKIGVAVQSKVQEMLDAFEADHFILDGQRREYVSF